MLQSIDENLWHAMHAFTANGLPITSRMTVVRLPGKRLLIHSPIPLNDTMRQQLSELGKVVFIVAPNLYHHLFLASFATAFSDATIHGPLNLHKKCPDIATIQRLPSGDFAEWLPDLEHFAFEGIPAGSESVWFHRPSATLIVTDLVQWMQGQLPWSTKTYAMLTGVHKHMAVPLTVRLLTRDRAAAARSAERLLRWPFKRVVFAHNTIIEIDAQARMRKALDVF
ncbi:DUF4336 domain-containing protein [Diaphorobacter sp. HDW4B]|uniref:DUF4336 domain-containing protein n=1 Tax=Diaphorobacter sp. HDW4B TaxID=2714925 RepID=UPI00140E8A1F|nr:DUF4336 domain-containing protein [Diaphorobacter sp. HDW4B]QIL70723.1 DUF4336 domain-containing protein [Diaphorobacter sp. HDW4B]